MKTNKYAPRGLVGESLGVAGESTYWRGQLRE
jgi:hypothetical protein